MSKYIIRNCPCYSSKYEYCLGRATKYCKDAIYCPMKQIVELCKNKDYFVKRFPNAEFSSGVQNSELAYDILKLLDIQEVE